MKINYKIKTIKMKVRILLVVLFLFVLLIPPCVCQNNTTTCHYTCVTCLDNAYYSCQQCQINRGITFESNTSVPFAGMCYCTGSTDEDAQGQCTVSNTFNYNNKALIAAFIGLSLLFSFIMVLIRGFRYYFIKIIQDVQQLSLIVFINMYFPQQFDIFLTNLYRFNISSYMFEVMAEGNLFVRNDQVGIMSTDGSDVSGKYKLLYKTANFFSNIFTWLVVFLFLLLITFLLKWIRSKLITSTKQAHKASQQQISGLLNISQSSINNAGNNDSLLISQNGDFINQRNQKNNLVRQKFQIKQMKRDAYENTWKNLIIRMANVFCFNLVIVFFYLSLIEININIFTQMFNLTFSSDFAAAGAFFSAWSLATEIIVIVLLLLKCRQELIKPEWMQDQSYSALHYLIRTNYKTATKYFFFVCSAKKIIFAFIVVVFYDSPDSSIVGITTVQILFLCLSVYLQPFQKRYIRIHFYLCETLKLFFFISMVNFVEQYRELTVLIQVTKILFSMLAGIFGFHFVSIMLTLIIEFKVYWYEIKRIFTSCKTPCSNSDYSQKNKQQKAEKQRVGYYHQVRGKQENPTQPSTPKVGKQLKQSNIEGFQEKINHDYDSEKSKQKQAEQETQQEQQYKKYIYIYRQYGN